MSEQAPASFDKGLFHLILVLGLCSLTSMLTIRIMDPIVPTLAEHFSRTVPEIALVATSFSLGYAIGQPFIGILGDGYGKARLIKICLALLAVSLFLTALAVSYDMLAVARMLSGVVAGGVIPLSLAMIGDRVPMRDRQVVLARYFMVVLFGQVFGSLGGGIIGDYYGWRAVFAVTGCIVLVCFVLALFQLRANPHARREPLDAASIMARYRTVFQNRLAVPLYALVMAEAIFIFAVFPFTAAILAERRGVGPTEAGFVVASTSIGAFLYTLLAPRLIPLLGVKRLALAGASLISLALLLFLIDLPWQANIATFALHGGGFYMLHNNLQAQATELSQTARGSAVSLFAAFLFLGTALGPAVMGPLIVWWGVRPTLVFFAVAVLCVGLAARHILPETQSARA